MGDVVGFPVFQKRCLTQRFFQRANVLALQLLSALGFDGLCVGQFDNTNGDFFKFREFSGQEAAARAITSYLLSSSSGTKSGARAGRKFAEAIFIDSFRGLLTDWVSTGTGRSRFSLVFCVTCVCISNPPLNWALLNLVVGDC